MKIDLTNFDQAHVLIVGDIILDRYWHSKTTRISSEAPIPIVTIDTVEERPGGSANVAMNVASLGAISRLIGVTGIDDEANILNTQLNNVNVTCNLVKIKTHPTIVKLRIISHNQQLIRVDFEKKFTDIDATPILDLIKILLPKTNVLVCSDYAKGTLDNIIQLIINQARAANVPVLVDPKGNNFNRYNGATLLTPNLSEFEAVVGLCNSDKNILINGIRLINDYNLSALLITRSEKGMILLQPDKEPLYLPAQAQEVYDVTGAGDTVIGVLAAALAAGNSLENSCFIANAAAGIVVGKLGTATVSLLELTNLLYKYEKNI